MRSDKVIEQATIELLDPPARAKPSVTVVMKVRVTNTGSTTWNQSPGEVRLGVQLLNADGGVIDRDYVRHDLGGAISSGEVRQLDVPVTRPGTTRACTLKLDLVREGVRWFEAAGSQPRVHAVDVTH